MFFALLIKLCTMAFLGALFFVPLLGGETSKISPEYIFNKYVVRAKQDNFVLNPPPAPEYAGKVPPPKVRANAFLVMDVRSGAVLQATSSEKSVPIASLTKIMTALVATEAGYDGEELITVESGDRVPGGVEYFFPGDKLKFKDLLSASLISSSNTAASIIARHIGGKGFIGMMNERARLMNLTGSTFADPTGLNPGNISTVYDIAKIILRAFGRPEISEILTKPSHQITVANTGRKIHLVNTDQLLGSELDSGEYKIVGGKTGYINESGYNLVLRVARGKDEIVVVVLGSDVKTERFLAAKALAFWAFENFKWLEN